MHLLDLLVFGVGLALAVLGVSYPLLRLTRLIRHQTQRHLALLTLSVLALATWLALLGYLFIPAHVLIDTAGRDGNAALWTMHAEERQIARTYAADDPRRITAEQTVADERRWYIERSVAITVALLVFTAVGYVVWLRNRSTRQTPAPSPEPT